ncbi:MAG TPA: hypothetical protein V6C91_11815 [Coleofasciculaceae cyanobacterium]
MLTAKHYNELVLEAESAPLKRLILCVHYEHIETWLARVLNAADCTRSLPSPPNCFTTAR